jgi:hypothetical protein
MRAAIVAPVLGAAAIAGIVTGLLLGSPRQEAVQRPALPAVLQQGPTVGLPATLSRTGPTQCHR